MTNPLVDSVFDKSTRDVARRKLTIGKNDFAIGILLTLAIVDVHLAYQAVTNKMSGKSAKDTKEILNLVRMKVHVHMRCTVRFSTCQCCDES